MEALEERCVPTTVTNLNDTGAGSLRTEIVNTAAGGIVDFAPGLSGTIILTSGEIAIDKNLIIAGPGAGVITVSGNNNSRVFDINSAVNTVVTVSGLTLTGGNGTGGGTGGGGAIRIGTNETVSINNTVVTGNATSTGDGGGLLLGSGSILMITNSTFSNNTLTGANSYGGGLYLSEFANTVTIEGSTISGNTATGYGGGLSQGLGSLNISNSTISGNTSAFAGGGISRDKSGGTMSIVGCTISGNTTTTSAVGGDGGGGIFAVGNTATVLDSTIADNRTVTAAVGGSGGGGDGGGIDISGGTDIFNPGSWTIQNSTIAFNSAADVGGGITTRGSAFPSLTLQSTIVADNTSAGAPSDLVNVTGTISADHDLIQTQPAPGTISLDKGGNLFGVDPLLGPLQNNGGPTQTRAVPINSPAVDRGSNPAHLGADQRGLPRTFGTAPDIGAFEVQAGAVPPTQPPVVPTVAPTVSVAFGPAGEVMEIVTTGGALFQLDWAGAHQLAGSGITSAGVAFGPAGEVMEIVTTGGALFQLDAGGLHQLAGTGIASAGVAFGPEGEVLEIVTTGGALFQLDGAGTHQLTTSGVASASVAFGPTGEVMEVVTTGNTLVQVDAGSPHTLLTGIVSAGVAFPPVGEVLDVILPDNTLVQVDAGGVHNLGKLA
jgi:hypothetical protein